MSVAMQLLVQLLRPEARPPKRSSEHAAGFDLYACERVELAPMVHTTVPLGFATAFSPGYVACVWDRSGLAAKHGVTTLAGVIDADYRGEWSVVLYNTTPKKVLVLPGERLAQVLFQSVETPEVQIAESLPESGRGEGGFGSTGR